MESTLREIHEHYEVEKELQILKYRVLQIKKEVQETNTLILERNLEIKKLLSQAESLQTEAESVSSRIDVLRQKYLRFKTINISGGVEICHKIN